jgi:hypothetical protein
MIYFIAFEVLTVVVMNISVFWHIMLCSLLKVNQRFRGTCCHMLSSWFLLGLFFDPKDGCVMLLRNVG